MSRALVIALAFAMLLLIGAVHMWTAPQYHFTAVYLVPVFLLAWLEGRMWALLAVLVGITVHCIVDVLVTNPFSPMVTTVDLLVHLGIAAIVAVTLPELRAKERALRLALDRERERASYDWLTGLLNARTFTDRLEQELERTRRYGGSLSLLYLDLDNFKQVNDTFGHLAGDEVLRRVANAIATTVRQPDIAGRLGGDEFVVLMPSTEADVAGPAAERLAVAVADALQPTSGVAASIGVVSCGTLPKTATTLISRADHAMYDAKRQGGARVKHVTMD